MWLAGVAALKPLFSPSRHLPASVPLGFSLTAFPLVSLARLRESGLTAGPQWPASLRSDWRNTAKQFRITLEPSEARQARTRAGAPAPRTRRPERIARGTSVREKSCSRQPPSSRRLRHGCCIKQNPLNKGLRGAPKRCIRNIRAPRRRPARGVFTKSARRLGWVSPTCLRRGGRNTPGSGTARPGRLGSLSPPVWPYYTPRAQVAQRAVAQTKSLRRNRSLPT